MKPQDNVSEKLKVGMTIYSTLFHPSDTPQIFQSKIVETTMLRDGHVLIRIKKPSSQNDTNAMAIALEILDIDDNGAISVNNGMGMVFFTTEQAAMDYMSNYCLNEIKMNRASIIYWKRMHNKILTKTKII